MLEAKIAYVQQIRLKAKGQENCAPISEYNVHLLYSQICKEDGCVDHLPVDAVFLGVSNLL